MLCRFFAVLIVATLTGCSTLPTPDSRLVRWGVVDPKTAAETHANTILGVALLVLPTGSMEPFLTGGDYIVADFSVPFSAITPGSLPVYDPNWADASVPLVTHMAVERTGDRWIVTGINNTYSESGSRAMSASDYRAMTVAVYTPRLKP